MEILKSEQYINEKLNIQPVSKNRLSDWNNDRLENLKEPQVDKLAMDFIRDYNLK